MKYGQITKCVILQDDTTKGTVLLGVAEAGADSVNFKVPYDWENLDTDGFCDDLQDRLAKDLDIATSLMEIHKTALLMKMKQYHYAVKAMH